jgi:hypothetical protein
MQKDRSSSINFAAANSCWKAHNVRRSNRLVPFFRRYQNLGGGVSTSLRSGCFASLGWLVVYLSCVRPERTNGGTPIEATTTFGFPGRKSWPEEIPFRPEGKNRKMRTGRQSGPGRGHTLLGCVSVRPLCPFLLGSGFIVVRPRSFVPGQWVVELHLVFPSLWLPNPVRVVPLPFLDGAFLAGVFPTPVESTADGVLRIIRTTFGLVVLVENVTNLSERNNTGFGSVSV